ncbi:MAG: hypothetical protein AAF291_07015 [Pseudomonadota bacterium]
MSEKTIRIHVGAHKTATTYIQDTLALNQAASAASGTAYWTREQFRSALSSAISGEKARRKSNLSSLAYRLLSQRRESVERLAGFFDLDLDITISDENLLGEAHDCFSGQVYPSAPIYLNLLKDALPDRPVEILLCVRSYASFLSSLYGESLRHGHFLRMVRFQEMHATGKKLWPNLVRVIHQAFPEATISVWRYEDFARLEDQVLSRMTGLAPEAIVKPSQSDILPSASSDAILAFVEEAKSLSYTQRQFRMLALQISHPRGQGSGKFSLWDGAQKAQLADEYDADIESLKKVGYVQFLG